MAPLSPIPDPDDWPSEIAEAAAEEFNILITVTYGGTEGTYDPITDSYTGGTEPTVLLEDRPARAQHKNLPAESAGAAEWATKRRYHFQTRLQDGDPAIPKGAKVSVTAGGRDPVLESYTFVVITATNSSHAALRTIETVVEQ